MRGGGSLVLGLRMQLLLALKHGVARVVHPRLLGHVIDVIIGTVSALRLRVDDGNLCVRHELEDSIDRLAGIDEIIDDDDSTTSFATKLIKRFFEDNRLREWLVVVVVVFDTDGVNKPNIQLGRDILRYTQPTSGDGHEGFNWPFMVCTDARSKRP